MAAKVKCKVRDEAGRRISNATVTLLGPGQEPHSGETASQLSWTRQLHGFAGTIEECWEQFVAPAGINLPIETFKREISARNPLLSPKEVRLKSKQFYLLPEYRAIDTEYGFVWDCPLTDFREKELNLGLCHKKYVLDKGVNMDWHTFSCGVVHWNQMQKEKVAGVKDPAYVMHRGNTYIIPRVGPRIYSRLAITGEKGKFLFPCLDKGNYRLRVQAADYESQTIAPLHLKGGETLTFNITLRPRKGSEDDPDNSLAGLASNASHLFTFNKFARAYDLIGSNVIALRGGANLVFSSDIPGCQGRLVLPGGQPGSLGAISTTYDWGRDGDRCWEMVFCLSQPGHGLLLSHPQVVQEQRIIEGLGFDEAGSFFVQPAGSQEAIILPGVHSKNVGKIVYVLLSFASIPRELTVTYRSAGSSQTHSIKLQMVAGQLAGGEVILGGAGLDYFAGNKRTAGIEIHHFAVYDKPLKEKLLKRRLAILQLA